MHLTIQEFSKRTGLPPSKLRFYDKKELLQPIRLENGYRAYSIDQIHLAKMIDSLRQVDIAISDIKHYSMVDEQEKKVMLERWKKELDHRMQVLLAARKYVGGIQVENSKTILLSKWEKEKHFIWQTFEVERNPHPFQNYFQTARNRIENFGVSCSEEVYVKIVKLTTDTIIGEIGFEVRAPIHSLDNDTFQYERIPPTLFAVKQDCRADDAFLCFSYIEVVIRYGFQPKEYKLERYPHVDAEVFDYLIPLVQ